MNKLDSNSRFGVLGYGSWASAIVGMLNKNHIAVNWHVKNPEVLEGLKTEHRNPKYVSDLEFDMDFITLYEDINDMVKNSDIIIMSIPSAFLKSILEPLQEELCDKFIISAIKGIVPGEYVTVTEYLNQKYNIPFRQMGVIAGPTHAEEVSRDKLSYLTIASSYVENASFIGSCLRSKSIHLSFSDDLYGVEYASILKNIYALAVGLAYGLGYGDNFIAVLVSSCANEMTKFIDESYPYKRNTLTSAYLGDLLVTCYSSYSRNRRLGQLIGHGCTVKSALNEMTMIAEGYYASECIRHLNLTHKVEMPIADMVYGVLYQNKQARKAMDALSGQLEK